MLIAASGAADCGARQVRARTPFAEEEVLDRMLAVVAGDLIMLSDVRAAVEFGLVPRPSGPDVTRAVLTQLIDRSLMLAEVERYAPPEPGRPPWTASCRWCVSAFRLPMRSAPRWRATASRRPTCAKHCAPTCACAPTWSSGSRWSDRRTKRSRPTYREHPDVFTARRPPPVARRGARRRRADAGDLTGGRRWSTNGLRDCGAARPITDVYRRHRARQAADFSAR